MASGNDLQFGTGEKGKTRGQRQPYGMSVETFEAVGVSDDQIESKKVQFLSGNPFVEVTKGVVHLYKENERTPLDKAESGRSEMLLMMAVPSTMSCRDLIQFIAPFQGDVEHIKIIRDSIPNQYMVLIKFMSVKQADAFYQALNGTAFNSLEEDLCNLAYVARIETVKETEDGVGLPILGHTELPTCPVCLERMDESVDGVLTILCNHSFHSVCLSKWSDARCPVCRFVQIPEMVARNQCFECGSSESLWICLICGHIGCGRYVHGHAYKHFCETSHCYAIQPENNRVWDYVGDNFVHRLLQNKDGKMVEVGGHAQQADLDGSCDTEDKLDSMQLEFTYTLTTQLESQRYYFEEKLAKQAKDMQREIEKLNIRLEEHDKYKEDTDKKISLALKEKAALERKVAALTQKLNKAYSDLQEEKALNKHLNNDQEKWQALVERLETEHETYVKEKTAEMTDLKEQLRDVMFYLEGQKVIEDSPLKNELAEGHVVVGPSTEHSKKDRRKKR